MFIELLKKEILKESVNYYTDNLDHYTFGTKRPLKKVVINQLKRLFFNKPVISIILSNDTLYKKFFLGRLLKFGKYIEPLEYFYVNLATEESKYLFLRLVTFRVLGYVKVKLPLSNPQYWKGIQEFEQAKNENDFVAVKSFPWKLYLLDINKFGFPFKMYISPKGGYTTFILQQYVKNVDGKNLGPAKDDVVLDLGGCYGDTGIFFSYLIGDKGKVYSFEFISGNVEIYKKNLAINNIGNDRVEIVQHPVWDSSDKKIYYKDAGAASQISFEKFEGYEGESTTLTVDDFVERYNIQKLDFIKTDIEGAEPMALKGAIKTLTRFKPKLAISIYHSMDDFTGIIRQVNELRLGYKFYLGHYTIYASETVLYCSVE